MLEQMSYRQFREWRAFYDIEPFGDERADYGFASIVATLVNLHRKKGTKARPIGDFLLRFGDAARRPRKTWQEMKAIGAMLTAAANQPSRRKKQPKK